MSENFRGIFFLTPYMRQIMMTVLIDILCDVLVCVKSAIWLVLSSSYHFWQMIHCSLQTKTNKQALLWQENRTYEYEAVVKCIRIEIYSGITCFSRRQHGFLVQEMHWYLACYKPLSSVGMQRWMHDFIVEKRLAFPPQPPWYKHRLLFAS